MFSDPIDVRAMMSDEDEVVELPILCSFSVELPFPTTNGMVSGKLPEDTRTLFALRSVKRWRQENVLYREEVLHAKSGGDSTSESSTDFGVRSQANFEMPTRAKVPFGQYAIMGDQAPPSCGHCL